MSYSRTFRPTKEVMDDFKPYTDEYKQYIKNGIATTRLEILVRCLLDNNEETVRNLCSELRAQLMLYGAYIKQDVTYGIYQDYLEDEYNLVTIYGRRDDEDEEDIINNSLEDLVVLSKCVNTNGYFGENSHFWDLRREVKEVLDYFYDEMYDYAFVQITKKLEPFEMHDDDFDDFGEPRFLNVDNEKLNINEIDSGKTDDSTI